MDDDPTAVTRIPWRWDWVPGAPGGDTREQWIRRVADLFEDWTRDGLDAARAAWPADADAQFPLTAEMVGRGAAEWLLERATELPSWARLAWGAAFVGGKPRWAPVPVVVEFCEPVAEDSVYLMEQVGANGQDGDAREPVVDYVTTPYGDGIRVLALARTAEGAAYARVNAAMRLDVPPHDGAARISADVLLTALVFDMGLMAVIGTGVEELMQTIAAESVQQAGGGSARFQFATVDAGETT